MIDSHCHLTDSAFLDDFGDVLSRAEENGIDSMICIADSIKEAKEGFGLAEKYEQIFCTAGVHPHNAKDWKIEDEAWLRSIVRTQSKMVAIGEIGLDYHYDNSPRDTQRDVFKTQLQIAKDLDLPAVIHNRESLDDLWSIVQEVDPQKAVLHCCTETWSDIEKWIQKGYWLSFTGIATYKSAGHIREVIANCPMDRLMIETDAPYLAPVPHRGKRNEPAFVREVAKLVANLKNMDLAEVDEATTKNTIAFFEL